MASPALLVLGRDSATLLVASFYASHAARSPVPVAQYRSYDYERPPDPAGELTRALGELAGGPGAIGVEASSLPTAVADVLRAQGGVLVPVDDLVVAARRIKLPVELDAIRRASHLSDVVQAAVKELAQPGMSEAEVAAEAQARMAKEAGRRVPAILTVTTGEATVHRRLGGDRPDHPGRRPRALRHLAVDRRPLVGQRQRGVRRDAERRPAPHLRPRAPGARARDRALRTRARCPATSTPRCAPSSPTSAPTYPHHTGHGIGASWSEPPRITPYERIPLEEGMVLAVEPAFYAAGFGGIRLEHVFVVRAGGNEILTRFEHTL